ncbi:sensor histidine kinase [Collimonas silvisoli]|uniref:sensor histidine kinase n=1 Tax=Collimonas silvisoli TaxID=2825884 RepID=UPI001B8D0374|nr:response regulator [Collimonas silvisoli]
MDSIVPVIDPPEKILIAEDSPTQAQRLRNILEQQGYEVSVAANGRLALEMARQLPPALIISDVIMPEMDGYQLCRSIKADPALHNIPVILVTTMSDPQDVIRGLECGADNFVLKPYDERYLLSRVQYVVLNRALRRTEDAGMGVEIYFDSQRHFITADRLQILNLLLSTYDAAIQRNKELNESKEALEISNQELESFSYSVSHDLRAPLRAIDGYANILEEDYASQLDEEGLRYLSVIRNNTKRMSTVIDELLAFSRLALHAIIADELDMNQLVQEVIESTCQDHQEYRAHKIAVNSLPPAQADRGLLRQVWANLISNALKYSSKTAAPMIEISGRSDGVENVYSVRDNGAGFSMEYYDKLFGVFQRLHRNEDFPGIGVGLAIVHRVVTRHGGRVWAEGKVNHGAVFYFALQAGEKK